MPVVVTHAFVSAIADGTDTTLVRPSSWNANHVVTNAASLVDPDQVVSGGASVVSNNLGTITTGTLTFDVGLCPNQYVINGGAFTLAAPSNDGSALLLTTNNASAGVITFSGFTVGANTGDSLDTTNTHKFTISIWRINGIAGYRVAAHQ